MCKLYRVNILATNPTSRFKPGYLYCNAQDAINLRTHADIYAIRIYSAETIPLKSSVR